MADHRRAMLSPQLHAAGPARDERFRVVERWVDCANFPPGDPERIVEFLHRQMNEEVNSLEASARSVCDFPDADWELRLDLARQCADEARHAKMFRGALERKGGRVGQYPVLNFQFRIIVAIPTLIGRLAVQNRSFEAGGLDAVQAGIADAQDGGDVEMEELFQAQLADEVQHVRFANRAIAAMRAREPVSLLRIGTALTAAQQAFREVMGDEGVEGASFPVASEARREAGFSDEEIRLAADLQARAPDAGG